MYRLLSCVCFLLRPLSYEISFLCHDSLPHVQQSVREFAPPLAIPLFVLNDISTGVIIGICARR
jgi:hypothetical protein